MTRELDRLVGLLQEGFVAPERLPDALASMLAWLKQPSENHTSGLTEAVPPAPSDRDFNAQPLFSQADQADQAECAVCRLFAGTQLNGHRLLALFTHARAAQAFAEAAASQLHASHVAAIVLAHGGEVIACDSRAESLLKAGDVLRLCKGELHCAEEKFQAALNSALAVAADSGRPKNLLIHKLAQPGRRFSLSLTPMLGRTDLGGNNAPTDGTSILCLVAPLDGRRIATARQLMELFGLSAAEARLARAISHGSSVEAYAHDQGLGLPTVRTQLSAVLNKTGAERQASLVRLIAGIPVVRDEAIVAKKAKP